MSPEQDQQFRFAVATEMAALQWRTDPVLLPSHSNDAWLIEDPSRGACVLRICWRGDRGRLITEAKLGRALPKTVGYPDVLGYGWTRDDRDLSWMLTRRLDGVALAEVWPELSGAQQARAGRRVAGMLMALHRWRPSATLSDRLLSWPRSDRAAGVLGATINPLPLERVRTLAAEVATSPWVDPALIDAAVQWLADHPELAPEIDQPGMPVTHGDLHLGNVWWDGRRVCGLLDLEWARLAQPYLDLSRLADRAAADQAVGAGDHQQFLETIIAAYPELAVSGLDDRLRYSQIAFQLRQILAWGDPAGSSLPADHPARLLEDLLRPARA